MRYGWILSLLLPAAAGAADFCDNAQIPVTTPLDEFEIHGDGTVTHERTRLMWSRCLIGQSGELCAGTPTVMPWDQALQAAATAALAGYQDWRLPNRAELASLVEFCRAGPSLNTMVFPAGSSAVWTGTPYAGLPGLAWVVRFDIGAALPFKHEAGAYVRLVRKVYSIGDRGPAGGIVFYDKGDDAGGWRYLEAAPRQWNAGEPDPWETWGCAGTLVGATAAAIGAGSDNTAILADPGCSAPARIAAAAEINGYDDWFLPSRDELEAMHDNLATHTNFRDEHGFAVMSYASSTELDENSAVAIDFAGGGGAVLVSKSLATVVVRPVRAF
ncbi:MAG TPA: DUF1566 domain-containing protein [Gammaproteobacteria bacterium]